MFQIFELSPLSIIRVKSRIFRATHIVQPSSQQQAIRHTEYSHLMVAAGDVELTRICFLLVKGFLFEIGLTNLIRYWSSS